MQGNSTTIGAIKNEIMVAKFTSAFMLAIKTVIVALPALKTASTKRNASIPDTTMMRCPDVNLEPTLRFGTAGGGGPC